MKGHCGESQVYPLSRAAAISASPAGKVSRLVGTRGRRRLAASRLAGMKLWMSSCERGNPEATTTSITRLA